jgi:ABC-type transport system involved in cytochrome bd biosynthesis fused ATPase/permease subunit
MFLMCMILLQVLAVSDQRLWIRISAAAIVVTCFVVVLVPLSIGFTRDCQQSERIRQMASAGAVAAMVRHAGELIESGKADVAREKLKAFAQQFPKAQLKPESIGNMIEGLGIPVWEGTSTTHAVEGERQQAHGTDELNAR